MNNLISFLLILSVVSLNVVLVRADCYSAELTVYAPARSDGMYFYRCENVGAGDLVSIKASSDSYFELYLLDSYDKQQFDDYGYITCASASPEICYGSNNYRTQMSYDLKSFVHFNDSYYVGLRCDSTFLGCSVNFEANFTNYDPYNEAAALIGGLAVGVFVAILIGSICACLICTAAVVVCIAGIVYLFTKVLEPARPPASPQHTVITTTVAPSPVSTTTVATTPQQAPYYATYPVVQQPQPQPQPQGSYYYYYSNQPVEMQAMQTMQPQQQPQPQPQQDAQQQMYYYYQPAQPQPTNPTVSYPQITYM